jgi:hypothetical protein
MTEFDYPAPVSQLLTLGDCRGGRPWPDCLALGLGPEHVPDLIRMVLDEELHWADSDSQEVWSPIHAWRALALLQAPEAVEPLTRLFARIDKFDDDWVGEDLPQAFGVLGPAAIPALRDYLADPAQGLFARIAASASLGEIGKKHPDSSAECAAVLAAQLERFAEMDPGLNGFIISDLVDLQAVQAAPIIERAFAAKCVDLAVMGDWEEAQIRLGLLQERQTPQPRFFSPLAGLRDLIPPEPESDEPQEKSPRQVIERRPSVEQMRAQKRKKAKRRAKRKRQKQARKKRRKR